MNNLVKSASYINYSSYDRFSIPNKSSTPVHRKMSYVTTNIKEKMVTTRKCHEK